MEELAIPPPRVSRPPSSFVYCYICGRQFGSSSISIHQPQCLKKWRVENGKLPKKLRRSEPVPPEVIHLPNGDVDYEATNLAAYEASLAQLMRCENCGRKFASDRLPVHQRSCTSENPAKAVGTMRVRRDVPLATMLAIAKRNAEVEEDKERLPNRQIAEESPLKQKDGKPKKQVRIEENGKEWRLRSGGGVAEAEKGEIEEKIPATWEEA